VALVASQAAVLGLAHRHYLLAVPSDLPGLEAVSETQISPESKSLFTDALKVINDAQESIAAFESPDGNPDGYCACGPSKPCYLHGVTIPRAVEAAELIAQELRRKAFPPKRVAE
jgi:hypothetical protein